MKIFENLATIDTVTVCNAMSSFLGHPVDRLVGIYHYSMSHQGRIIVPFGGKIRERMEQHV